ncbi:hypothetical protein FO519_005608 [Halicephalobus sp. NKZ332]|nr:hypothetical protein FO519_005608 [Halicephalobus sp. NKZ332]
MPVQSKTTQKEFTILLLGMTGVGKSTFINSIANYLSYEKLGDAIDKAPQCIIPTKFTHTIREPNKQGYTLLKIEMIGINGGDVDNEESKAGESCTKAPRSYSFIQDNIKINIIDVPGVGDTRGVLVDKQNKKSIMEKISEFSEIHSVWIMLKATDNKLTGESFYSLNDIFSIIPKTIVENVSFVITNSKACDFNPGDIMGLLNEFVGKLNTSRGLNINYKDVTFCIDNESFKAELKNNLMKGIDIYNDINVSKEKLPKTVCTSKKCSKWTTNSDGEEIFEYTQVCHEDCHLKNVVYGKMPQDALIDCQAFDLDKNCMKCRCSYTLHTHIYYNLQNVVKTEKIIPKSEAESDAYIKQHVEQLEKMRKAISDAFFTAYQFLHQNAVLTFNETLIERIDMEIRVQETSNKSNEEVVNNLKKVKDEHQKFMKELKNIDNTKLQKPVTYEEFEEIIDSVFRMPPLGSKIKEIYDSERDSANQYLADFEPLPVKFAHRP